MKEIVEEFKADFAVKVVENFNRDKEITPCFLLFNKERELFPVATPFENEMQKQFISDHVIPAVIKQIDAVAVVFITEAWVKKMTKDEVKNFTGAVSDQPDKEEVVLMSIETIDETFTKMWSIKRPEGKDPYLEESTEQTLKFGEYTGKFTNFLKGNIKDQN